MVNLTLIFFFAALLVYSLIAYILALRKEKTEHVNIFLCINSFPVIIHMHYVYIWNYKSNNKKLSKLCGGQHVNLEIQIIKVFFVWWLTCDIDE